MKHQVVPISYPKHFSPLDFNLIGTSRVELTPHQVDIRVASKDWEVSDCNPGQFALLELLGGAPHYKLADPIGPPTEADQLIRRTYFILSPSLVLELIRFCISLVRYPAQASSQFGLCIGDSIWLSSQGT
jgi:hypothetical protein